MASLDLPSDRSAASRARRFTRETLSRFGIRGDVVDAAELLVSELVTNAVLHAHSASRLEIVRADDRVRVAVQDSSSSLPTVRRHDTGTVTGRGLMLVDRLACEWGVEPARPTGKCVWFELTAERAPSSRVQMQD